MIYDLQNLFQLHKQWRKMSIVIKKKGKTHDLTLVYTYPTCDTSVRSLVLTYDQRYVELLKNLDIFILSLSYFSRYIIVGLSTGCLIVFNINFNVISYRKKNF